MAVAAVPLVHAMTATESGATKKRRDLMTRKLPPTQPRIRA
jgi:hypothetical protein